MVLKDKVTATEWAGDIAFTITERTADRVVGEMPVAAGMLNPFGTVHAGAMTDFWEPRTIAGFVVLDGVGATG